MTIAYAKRNPLAILKIPKNVSMKIEAELNLLSTKTATVEAPRDEADLNDVPKGKERNTDSCDTINLEHVDDQDLRTRIITMLSRDKDM